MLGARAGALALAQGTLLEVVAFHDSAGEAERGSVRSLNVALTDVVAKRPELMLTSPAAKLIGAELAEQLGWKNLTLAKIVGTGEEEFLGVLCLADCEAMDQNLLQAVVGQAAVAMENARLFSRIAQSNRHWMEIFDAMEDLMLVHDESNRVLRVNRAMAESIGALPSELIGMSMRALVSFSTARGSQGCPFCRRVGDAAADEYVHPVLGRTYLVSTSRIHGALEEGLQTIHVLKDISERREAEQRYRELFDNIQEGLYFSTPDGRFVEVNDALVRMLRYSSREELLQVNIDRDIYFQPDQRQRFKDLIERQGVLRNFEETLRRKDSSLMHTLQNSFAVRDESGKVVQYRGLILDITEQKKFQAQLQRERDFNSKVLNNTQSFILVADTAGLVTYANRRCFEAGTFREGELLGRRLRDLVQSERRESFEEAFEATLHGHQVNNLELPFMRADSRIAHFSVNLSPMRDEQADVSSVVVVMTDVTDSLMIQAKLMHTEKMAAIGQLVSGVAHEVNNPLTAIMGFADLLQSNTELPDTARQELGIIMQEAQRTKVIVQNLLSFARKMPAQREPLEVNEIVRRTLQLRAYDFSRHGVDVVEQLDTDVPAVMGDPHQLQQVVLNIVNNAYDAVRETGKPGHIVVKTGVDEGYTSISVRDSGTGIAHPERIFDPFFTTKEVGKGTGLGLSICYGIVREHGGEVLCHNNEDGPGATFTVRLPMLAAEIGVGS